MTGSNRTSAKPSIVRTRTPPPSQRLLEAEQEQASDSTAITAFDQEVKRVEGVITSPAQRQVAAAIVTFLGIRPHMKFTPHVVSTWCRVLGEFEIQIVNRAVLECWLSREEFVVLPEIFHRCRELTRDREAYCPAKNERVIPKSLINRTATNLGLDIGQRYDKNHEAKRCG